jgi:hypothetical protein
MVPGIDFGNEEMAAGIGGPRCICVQINPTAGLAGLDGYLRSLCMALASACRTGSRGESQQRN